LLQRALRPVFLRLPPLRHFVSKDEDKKHTGIARRQLFVRVGFANDLKKWRVTIGVMKEVMEA
jgi:hypothetical protein